MTDDAIEAVLGVPMGVLLACKVATVMHEAFIVAVTVLPQPIHGSEFAEVWVQRGDILTGIVLGYVCKYVGMQ